MISMYSHQELYREIGSLFYALAASSSSDGCLNSAERDALEEIVLLHWVNLENNARIDTDNAFQILFRVQDLENMYVNARKAYEDFEEFYDGNKHLFDERLRRKIYTSAASIAGALKSRDNQDDTLLLRLQAMLELESRHS